MIGRFPATPRQGLVLLHGRGGSAADTLRLADHAGLTDVAVAAPEAPGNSWWPTSFLAPAGQMAPFLDRARDSVALAIARLEDAGLQRSRIWLGGFSQGACLALEAFARDGAGLAGVLAFSGGLIGRMDSGPPIPDLFGHSDKTFDYPEARPGTVWMSLHESDPHIPLRRAQDSAAALRSLSAEVTLRLYPGAGHSVMRDDIAALRQHLTPG